MKFAVLGAGAIGAYVGAAIARGGTDVTLIARGPHLDAMRANGVRVLSPLGDFIAHPAVSDEVGAVAGADVVFVALKAYSLAELAPQLGEVLDPGAAVIWAQNGVPWWYFQNHEGPLAGSVIEAVDPGGVISNAIEPKHNVGCVLYCATEIIEPGVIRHIEGTRLAIGEPDGGRSQRCQAISSLFSAGGLKAPIDRRLRDQIWLKLVGNVAFNPITALTGATLGQLAQLPEVVELLEGIFAECGSVAAALDITFPIPLSRRLQAGLAVGDHRTSMLQDRDAHKPFELGCLTGAVIELAAKVEVDVPRVRAVHACALLLDTINRGQPA
jgi:2-dehydropantoate 2-reductase